MLRSFLAVPLLATFCLAPAHAAPLGGELASVRNYAQGTGEALWPGYGAAPFGFLLIDKNQEILLCRENVPDGFTAAGLDADTQCPRFTRPRGRLPNSLLAAMPLFGPPSVIVMGTPDATGRSPADWLRTILHEHFHQWQAALPDHYARVDALDLKGGDETGMWMLNYPFPYDDAVVGRAYAAASLALAATLEAQGTPRFPTAFDRYLASRKAFAGAAGEENWRYLEFQLWQEGVARWTEIVLGMGYPDPAVRQSAQALREETLRSLRDPDLARQRRELAYPFGAGEAMLLELCGRNWREGYVKTLALASLLADAQTRCGASS